MSPISLASLSNSEMSNEAGRDSGTQVLLI